jgi:hypothetical protein
LEFLASIKGTCKLEFLIQLYQSNCLFTFTMVLIALRT